MINEKKKDKVEIYESKKKLFSSFFWIIFVFILGVFTWYVNSDFRPASLPSFGDNEGLYQLAGAFLAIVGGVLIPTVIIRLFNNKPVLIVNHEGIIYTENLFRRKECFIGWDDVLALRIEEYKKQKLICVYFHNEDEYIKSLNLSGRMLARFNIFLGFPPITFNAALYKGYNSEDTLRVFRRYKPFDELIIAE